MAKLFIKRQPDGTYTLRGERVQDKQLTGHAVSRGVGKGNLREEVLKIWAKVVPTEADSPSA